MKVEMFKDGAVKICDNEDTMKILKEAGWKEKEKPVKKKVKKDDDSA